MTFLNTVFFILGSIASLGIFAFGAGYLISQFKKGSTQKDNTLMANAEQITNFYKDQAESYKVITAEKERQWNDKEKEWNEKFTELTREVGQIKGQLAEKEKQAKEYLDILNNRDPKMEKFMEFMVQSTKNQTESHQKIVNVLSEIHTMAKMEHERDFTINATVTKQ